jgi:hypothetical protein
MKTSLFPLLLSAYMAVLHGAVGVDAADLSAAAAGMLVKSKNFLSNLKPVSQVSHLQGRGDEISRSRDDLKKPLNVVDVASMVIVKKKFFS